MFSAATSPSQVMLAISINLRFLKAQLLALRRFHIDATTTPVHAKYGMFVALFWCASNFSGA